MPSEKYYDQTDRVFKLKGLGVKNISAAAGRLQVREGSRNKVCFLSDGTLCVLGGHESDMDIKEYEHLIQFEGIEILRKVSLSLDIIRRMYTELVGDSGPEFRPMISAKEGGEDFSQTQTAIVTLITDAVGRSASDIHITVFADVGHIAFRTHGDLYKVMEIPAQRCIEYCRAIYHSMCDIADPTFNPQVTQDARMNGEFVKRCKLFGARVASGPTDSGSRMVIRLLYDSGKAIPSLEQLGYLPEQIAMVNTMRRLTSGINIVSGATGSGKSTSLSSILSSIIEDAGKRGRPTVENGVEEFLGLSVVTIEDPPEYKINKANQTPLIAKKLDAEDIKQAWARAITACMRQDPDVMMIGEIRDQGSAKAAFDAALTGHGVWTTVHTTDAVGIMMRLNGLGVESDRMLDPEIVTGLINQSLAQRLCSHCSIAWDKAVELGRVQKELRARVERYCVVSSVKVKGDGCPRCKGTGITGRIVVAEVIMPNLEFMEVFAKGGKTRAKQHWIVNMGGITKCMALIRRINQGLIDPAEGDTNVMPLDRDFLSLGVDYSKTGSLPLTHMLTLPNTTAVEEFMRALPQRGVEQAIRLTKYKERQGIRKATDLEPKAARARHKVRGSGNIVSSAKEANHGSIPPKAWRNKRLSRRPEALPTQVRGAKL